MVSDRTDFSTDLVMKHLGNETPVIRKAAQLTNYRGRRKGHQGRGGLAMATQVHGLCPRIVRTLSAPNPGKFAQTNGLSKA